MGQRSSDDLRDDLQRWASAGLISKDQVEAILAHETATPTATPEGRVSVLAEALGYAGAALAVAGITTAFGNSWDSLGSVARIAVAAVPTLLAVAAGWVLRMRTEPAFRRLMSLLWFLSIGGFAGTAGVVLAEYVDVDGESVPLILGIAMAVPAFVLWRLHREVLQQMALLGSVLVVVIGALVAMPGEPNGVALTVAAWLLGMLWATLGWTRVLEPYRAATVLGALLGAYAPILAAEEHRWMLFVGVATGAALMAASIPTRATPVLAIGTVAVFAYVTAIVVRYFGDQLGVPLALTIIGAVFIGLALLAARLGRIGAGRAR